jgi:formate dehydrogenase major subunit
MIARVDQRDGRLVELTIDGRPVRVPCGTSILEAAAAAGVALPMMCFAKGLPVEEACRLCVVEVEGQARPLAACATPAQEGMVVRGDSPRLARERAASFRLLLEDHYGDCLAPCSMRCPANIDIQGYIALIARGQYLEATRLIRRTNPLPLTCGRVCPHPCESQCRRGRVDQPININHLKRFASDRAYERPELLNPPRAPLSGHWVAVVGGGPAGLSAAYYLALAGHSPVIFEAMPQLGGMLRYGIPEYRLPKAVLDRELAAIMTAGVQARLNRTWTRDFTLTSLMEEGFAAVFLGVGAWVNRRMGLAGEDAAGVWPGTVFLNQVALGRLGSLAGQRVAVVGGGNTAMDCARTALRLGASRVVIYYRRSRKEMPAQVLEVDEAEREGVEMELCVAPVTVHRDGDRLTGMSFQLMELCGLDASGRAEPKPIEGSERRVDLDLLIVAIGQQPEAELLERDPLAGQLALNRRGNLEARYQTGATNLERVFAGGDLVSGPATVVEAIGAGRRAAKAMDRFLGGRSLEPARPLAISKGALAEVDQSVFQGRVKAPRVRMPELTPQARSGNFLEVELGLSEEAAQAEARRCLACGCQAAHDCRIRQVAGQLGLNDLVTNPRPAQPGGLVTDHPRIVIDDNKCVVCRTCQRACRHFHGRSAITVEVERVGRLDTHRPHRTRINDRCDSCGLCVSLCPTGALADKTAWGQPGPFPLAFSAGACGLCPLGCGLRLGKIGDHPVVVEASRAAPNHGHLCAGGRYELLDVTLSPLRLTAPLVRQGDQLVEVSWDEALAAVVSGLASIKAEAGGAALAALSWGRASLEELYLLAKLGRLGLGSANLGCLDPAQEDPSSERLLAWLEGGPGLPAHHRIEEHDLVVLVGSGLGQAYRLLEPSLHRLRAAGGKVILMAEGQDVLAPRADLLLELNCEQAWSRLADLLAADLPSGQMAPCLAGAERILLLGAQGQVTPVVLSALDRLGRCLLTRPGRAVSLALIPVTPAGRAAQAAGLSPAFLPGGLRPNPSRAQVLAQALRDSGPIVEGLFSDQIIAAMEAGGVRGLLVQGGLKPGEETSPRLLAAARRLDFLALTASFREPLCELAQVVLPRPLCWERAGALVDGAGDQRHAEAALAPPPGVRDELLTLGLILQGLTGKAQPMGTQAVAAELRDLSRRLAGV